MRFLVYLQNVGDLINYELSLKQDFSFSKKKKQKYLFLIN